MGYDFKAVKVSKLDKIVATLMFNKERKRHYIREIVNYLANNSRMRSARNKGKENE